MLCCLSPYPWHSLSPFVTPSFFSPRAGDGIQGLAHARQSTPSQNCTPSPGLLGTGPLCVAQAGFKLVILLPQSPQCWDYRCALLCQLTVFLNTILSCTVMTISLLPPLLWQCWALSSASRLLGRCCAFEPLCQPFLL
jgi:hypothetical protein